MIEEQLFKMMMVRFDGLEKLHAEVKADIAADRIVMDFRHKESMCLLREHIKEDTLVHKVVERNSTYLHTLAAAIGIIATAAATWLVPHWLR